MNHKPTKFAKFREKAEEALRDSVNGIAQSQQNTEQLIKEMHVHQTELEMILDELQRSSDALASSQKRYSKLFDSIPIGFVVINTEGRILDANAPLCKLLNVEHEELLGDIFGNYVMSPFQDLYFLSWRSASRSQGVQNYKMALRQKDGTSFPAFLSIDMPDKQNGEINLAILDISTLDNIEASLGDSLELEALLHPERLKVLSVISHEFRKPMASILASLELLHKHGARLTSTKKGELYQTIQNLVWYLTDALQDAVTLQAFEEQSILKLQSFDLLAFCRQIINDMEAIKPEEQRISLDTVVHYRDAMVFWDVNMFRRILMNLLRYSFSYSSEDIHCRLELKDSVISVRVEQQETVLSKEELASMFDEFCAGKNSEFVQGRGNGLFTVYNTVRAHGGTMDCETQAEGWVCYVIELPRHLISSPSSYQQ
jgi:PAS domain S-box-containing protein